MGHAHRGSSEAQTSPLGAITPFSEQELILSLDNPALQLLSLSILKLPYYFSTSVSADPLSVQVNVYVDIKASCGMDTEVRGWNRLAEGRRRRDRRQEG